MIDTCPAPIKGDGWNIVCRPLIVWFYAVVMLTVGPILCILIPPFQIPDEPVHFYRAYQVSEGRIFARRLAGGGGGKVDTAYLELNAFVRHLAGKPDQKLTAEELRKIWQLKESGQRPLLRFGASAIYSAAGYVPQALGIKLARILSNRVVLHLVGGRVFNLLAFVLVVCFAMTIAPLGSSAFIAFSSLPIVLFQVCSVSQDASIIGGSILFTAALLRLLSERRFEAAPNQKLNRDVGLRTALLGGWIGGFIVVIGKFVYAPIIFLLVFAAWLHRRRPLWHMTLLLFGVTALCLLVQLIYMQVIGSPVGANADPAAQLQFMFHLPTHYLGAVWNTFGHWKDQFILGMIGVLGWLDTFLPEEVYFWYKIGAAFSFVSLFFGLMTFDWTETLLKPTSARLMLLVSLVAVVVGSIWAIATVFYLVWSPPGADMVNGIQARYFLPFVIVTAVLVGAILAASFASQKLARGVWPHRVVNAILLCQIIALVVSYYVVVATMLTRYYF